MKITAIRILICCFFFSFQSQGQSVVNTTGASISSSSILVEYSIGEIAITTLVSPINAITQGVLQPHFKLPPLACPVILTNTFRFENPTRDKIRLTGNYSWVTNYQIYAADGKLVDQSTFSNNYININHLPAAVYFIRLLPGCDGSFKVLKVIKQ